MALHHDSCGLAQSHGWRNIFKNGRAQAHVKKVWKMFVVWIGNCDITSIEIWRH